MPYGLRLSLHSPQPTRPSSVSMRTKVQGRQPPSQCRASTRAIFMAADDAIARGRGQEPRQGEAQPQASRADIRMSSRRPHSSSRHRRRCRLSSPDMARRPNFVFILADDLGYADLGCYGGRPAASGAPFATCSPSLDRMAREGLRFTQGYANSSVCSPTRFALMTGRWQHRLRGGADEPIRSTARGNPHLGLPPSHPTLPSLLRDAGYATALVGKWHLGYPPHFGPLQSGYQEFFGALSGGMDYFTHRDTADKHDLYENDGEVHRTGYLTDLISDRAVEFIGRKRKEPFLLSVHYNAPHWPWLTREDEAESKRIDEDLSLRRRLGRDLPHHDPPDGRGHRAHPQGAEGGGSGPRHAGRVHQRQRRRAVLRHLAAGRQEDGPARGRHPRALHRALAREGEAGPRHRPGGDHHGLGGHVPRCRRREAASAATRSTARACSRC